MFHLQLPLQILFTLINATGYIRQRRGGGGGGGFFWKVFLKMGGEKKK